jgi:hypothetical protein
MNGKMNVSCYVMYYQDKRMLFILLQRPLVKLWVCSRTKVTLVAELLVLRQAILQKRKCIIVLPFVSIVTEKTKHFRNLFDKCDVEVGSFHGGARAVDVWDIAICTIEKAFIPHCSFRRIL